MLYKKNSFTVISNKYTDLSQTIDFSQTPFLFQMTNDREKFLIFELEAYNIETYIDIGENGQKKNKMSSTKLEWEKCDKIFTNKSKLEYFSDLNLSSYIWIKPGQNITAYDYLETPIILLKDEEYI